MKFLTDLIDVGTLVSDNATNGDIIMAMFPNANYDSGRLYMHIINVNTIGEIVIPWRWWNAPYQKDSEPRDATSEERESVDNYIKSISTKTGRKFDE